MSATSAARRGSGNRGNAHRDPPARSRASAIGIAVSAVVLVVAVVAILVMRGGSEGAPMAVGGAQGGAETTAAALEPTGETNSMGFPVVTTPGSASGVAKAGGVEVKGADWTLGHVPLSVAVRPMWVIRNSGTGPVTLGRPSAKIFAGCCPGPFALSSKTLDPGESATLTFELAMHEGMDGWHDMGVYVPVSGEGGSDTLQLRVTGDFSN